jgi:D-3-phosphoglycerate dehydrogenase
MKVYFYDVITKLSIGNAKPLGNLDDLLAISDVVSLHVPETPVTKNMISTTEFGKMKKGAVFINASRGTVVNIDALEVALESHHLLGAAIDVFPSEPKSECDPFVCPLQKFDNVILTPHVGGSTIEAQIAIAEDVTEKMIRYSDNGTTLSSVNFPEVSLPEVDGVHRILHIHKNIPGVLSKINKVFSENNININAQYLRTRGSIGYVVVDVEAGYSKTVKKLLKDIEETIKCRAIY